MDTFNHIRGKEEEKVKNRCRNERGKGIALNFRVERMSDGRGKVVPELYVAYECWG